MSIVVIVEGQADKVIVETALRSLAGKQSFSVVSAGGRSSAVSLARSYFTLPDSRVALLLDADTVDSRQVREQQQILTGSLAAVAPRWAFSVVLAVPELEACLFEAPEVLMATLGTELTSEMLVEARFTPKAVLTRLLKVAGWKEDYIRSIQKVVSNIGDPESLAKCSPLNAVRSFIETVSTAKLAASATSTQSTC
jgi:hypothetical protein